MPERQGFEDELMQDPLRSGKSDPTTFAQRTHSRHPADSRYRR
jgi:hypothetical protein